MSACCTFFLKGLYLSHPIDPTEDELILEVGRVRPLANSFEKKNFGPLDAWAAAVAWQRESWGGIWVEFDGYCFEAPPDTRNKCMLKLYKSIWTAWPIIITFLSHGCWLNCPRWPGNANNTGNRALCSPMSSFDVTDGGSALLEWNEPCLCIIVLVLWTCCITCIIIHINASYFTIIPTLKEASAAVDG